MFSFVDSYYLYRIRVKRDAAAFGRIYDRYAVAMYRYAYLKVPAKEQAEEIASEVFLRTWEHLKARKPIQHLRAFLYQTLRHLIADYYREHAQTVLAVSEVVTFSPDLPSTDTETVFTDRGRGATQTEAQAELSLLIRRIAALKEDFQDVLHLRLIEGLSYDEIGSVLQKTPGHVRVIYHRAVKALEGVSEGG